MEDFSILLHLVFDPEDFPGAKALFRPVLLYGIPEENTKGVTELKSIVYENSPNQIIREYRLQNTITGESLLKGLGDGVDLVAHDDVVVEVRARTELAYIAQAMRGLENASNLRVIIPAI